MTDPQKFTPNEVRAAFEDLQETLERLDGYKQLFWYQVALVEVSETSLKDAIEKMKQLQSNLESLRLLYRESTNWSHVHRYVMTSLARQTKIYMDDLEESMRTVKAELKNTSYEQLPLFPRGQ